MISAFEDINGEFVSMVMFTPVSRGGTGHPAPGTGGINAGEMKIDLPDGFIASGAYAMKSYGEGTEMKGYWLEELVVLSADGKSALLTLPQNTIISVKFLT
jgi:hypothetical protein